MPRSVFLDSSLHISKFCRYIIWRRRASATEERPGRPAGLTLGYRAGSPPGRRSGASGTRNFEAVTSARISRFILWDQLAARAEFIHPHWHATTIDGRMVSLRCTVEQRARVPDAREYTLDMVLTQPRPAPLHCSPRRGRDRVTRVAQRWLGAPYTLCWRRPKKSCASA